jgi:hypothetical protein
MGSNQERHQILRTRINLRSTRPCLVLVDTRVSPTVVNVSRPPRELDPVEKVRNFETCIHIQKLISIVVVISVEAGIFRSIRIRYWSMKQSYFESTLRRVRSTHINQMLATGTRLTTRPCCNMFRDCYPPSLMNLDDIVRHYVTYLGIHFLPLLMPSCASIVDLLYI